MLNAKEHAREAEIIKDAGQRGAVTIATNMAGRGVDIKLGDGVVDLGGLYVLGTERHESRRIDNQLRGRSGRQGDPGETRFYLSGQDDLVRLFAGDRIHNIMERFKLPDDQPMEAGILSRQIENAQKKVEEQNFVARKNVLKYDDVMNVQRQEIYEQRRRVLARRGPLRARPRELDPRGDRRHRARPTLQDELREEWDLGALVVAMESVYGTGVTEDELRGLDRDAIAQEFVDDALEAYAEREAEVEQIQEGLMRDLERFIVLQVVDVRWREHLESMDYMREGIHLRGMAQKDPLVEYRNEGSIMFEELIGAIHEEVVTLLFHAEVTPDDAARSRPSPNGGPLSYEHESLAGADAILAAGGSSTAAIAGGGSVATPVQATKVNAEHENVGRNDPCWCGSGQEVQALSRRVESCQPLRPRGPVPAARHPSPSRRLPPVIASDGRILAREAAMTTFAAGTIAAVLLWAGPPGVDLAAHAYQRTLLLAPRLRALEQLLVRRALLVRHLQLHLLPAGGGVRDQGAGPRHDLRRGARVHAARLARVGAGRPALEPDVRRALGRDRPLGGLPVRARRRPRAARPHRDAARPLRLFAVLVLLTLLASPLAFLLLVVAARRRRHLHPHPRTSASSRPSSASPCCSRWRSTGIFPGSGRFPFGPWNLVPAVLFCLFGIVDHARRPDGRPLRGIFWIYLAACLVAYFVPSALGSNVERLRYAALPIVLLAVSLRRWRPAWLMITGVVLATSGTSRRSPPASRRPGRTRPAPRSTGRRPSRSCTRTSARASASRRSTPPITGRPSTCPRTGSRSCAAGTARPTSPRTSCSTTRKLSPAPYRAWLRQLGVRYVVISDAPPDYSSRVEAQLIRSGRSGLVPVFRARHVTVYAVPNARPLVTGPGLASVQWLWPTRAVIAISRPGKYRVALRWSPYWATPQGCVSRGADGMVRLSVRRAGPRPAELQPDHLERARDARGRLRPPPLRVARGTLARHERVRSTPVRPALRARGPACLGP